MRPFLNAIVAVFVGVVAAASPGQADTPAAAQSGFVATIAPEVASYGESVTITGIGFGGPGVVIRINGVVAPVVTATGTRVTFRVPLGVPKGPVVVTATNPGGHTGSIGFEVSGLVTLRLDEQHRISGPIGREGGVLTTQSNGRTFRLNVPPGALSKTEEIAMTPIVSIGGLPLEQLLGAVHFAPEGLQFFKAATLVIDLPMEANTHGLTGFSAAGNGENLHLVPFMMTGSAFSLVVPHFSVSGVGTGSASSLAAVLCRELSLECDYTNRLAQALQQALQTICGTGCRTADDLAAQMDNIQAAFAISEIPLLEEWFTRVLPRLLNDAPQSDQALIDAGHDYFAWRAWVNGYPCGVIDCADVPALADDIQLGQEALGAAYLEALERARIACSDVSVADLIVEIGQLELPGQGGLPDDEAGLRDRFACQLAIGSALPATVHVGDTVPIIVSVGLRTGGFPGAVSPLPDIDVDLLITSGCARLDDRSVTTNGDGVATALIQITQCVDEADPIVVAVAIGDVLDELDELVALGRTARFQTTLITVAIAVSPDNATVAPSGQVAYSVQVQGLGPLFTWSATGGTITPGPSATATFTAGSTGGTFSVTATSVDDPTQSQTAAVTITLPLRGTRLTGQLTLHGHRTHSYSGLLSIFTYGPAFELVEDTCLTVSIDLPLVELFDGTQNIVNLTVFPSAGTVTATLNKEIPGVVSEHRSFENGRVTRFYAQSLPLQYGSFEFLINVHVNGTDNRTYAWADGACDGCAQSSSQPVTSTLSPYGIVLSLRGTGHRSQDNKTILSASFDRPPLVYVVGEWPYPIETVSITTTGQLVAVP